MWMYPDPDDDMIGPSKEDKPELFQIPSGIDSIITSFNGLSRQTAFAKRICVSCRGPAIEFTDSLSRKEWTMSLLCQKCQDAVFNDDEDEDDVIEYAFNPDTDHEIIECLQCHHEHYDVQAATYFPCPNCECTGD